MTDRAAMRQMLQAVQAMRDGDFASPLPADLPGPEGELARALAELAQAQRARDAEAARVLAAVAAGELSQAMPLTIDGRPLQGERLRAAQSINATIERLRLFASEVIRVAREVGTDGKLGGQAEVPGVHGIWRQLTDGVNTMAANVTAQARHVSEITRAVAAGDLSKKITVEAQGEILELKETINAMVDQLRAFSSEILRVAREVGSEGKLDEQARIPGVAGMWKQLTAGFNGMIDDLRVTSERTEALLGELRATNAQLSLTSRYKSEFLANVSHELRTPLNSILLIGQQLAENSAGNLSARQLEYVRTICSAGADLLVLINDILDLAKIESGTVTVEPVEVSFRELLDGIERRFRHEAERRGLAFEISLDPAAGRGLVSDPKRLQQVLTNLLSNAFKFTAQGSVRLAVLKAATGLSPGDRSAVAFEVSDTGIGIPPEKQRLVFEAFQQADASTSRKYGGTGLGLAISRDLASLLGGELLLRSAPGAGSTFTLLLPLPTELAAASSSRSVPAVAREAAGAPPATAELRGRKVLVVDDDVRNLFALGSVLERHGMEVVPAQSGREAVSILRRTPGIAAVLMDIMMPELDGYQTIQLIRAEPAQRALPIVALTAKALPGDREKCLDVGASDYLAKPVDSAQLVTTLRAHLLP